MLLRPISAGKFAGNGHVCERQEEEKSLKQVMCANAVRESIEFHQCLSAEINTLQTIPTALLRSQDGYTSVHPTEN